VMAIWDYAKDGSFNVGSFFLRFFIFGGLMILVDIYNLRRKAKKDSVKKKLVGAF